MREEDFAENFVKEYGRTDFSSESKNKAKNLEALQIKLPIINEERKIYMNERKRRIRKPIAIAACIAVILSMSAVVFGQDIVNYVRTTMLGEYASFSTSPELTEEEIQKIEEQTQALIDSGEITITTSNDNWVEPEWVSFTDATEGKSHFITDVMLPTYAPSGFHFSHVFYFVENFEELQEHGANMYMGVIFSNGADEIRMQIRYMNEETGFEAGATENLQTLQINGHEAVVDSGVVNLLVDDVIYMFFGMGIVDDAELIKMAASLS